MSTDLKTILKNRIINKWSLFCLISIPMSTLMVIAMMGVDMSTAPGVSEMIGFSVRFAVPFIYPSSGNIFDSDSISWTLSQCG